jgi:hypothetical protein
LRVVANKLFLDSVDFYHVFLEALFRIDDDLGVNLAEFERLTVLVIVEQTRLY